MIQSLNFSYNKLDNNYNLITHPQKIKPALKFKGQLQQDCFNKTIKSKENIAFTGLLDKVKKSLGLDMPLMMRKDKNVRQLAQNAIENLDTDAVKTIEQLKTDHSKDSYEVSKVQEYILEKVCENIEVMGQGASYVDSALKFINESGLIENLTYDVIATEGKINLLNSHIGIDLPISPSDSTYKKRDLYGKVLSIALSEVSPLKNIYREKYIEAAQQILEKDFIDAFSNYREAAMKVIKSKGNIKGCLDTLLKVAGRETIQARVIEGFELPRISNKTFEEDAPLRIDAIESALKLLDKSNIDEPERLQILNKIIQTLEKIADSTKDDSMAVYSFRKIKELG